MMNNPYKSPLEYNGMNKIDRAAWFFFTFSMLFVTFIESRFDFDKISTLPRSILCFILGGLVSLDATKFVLPAVYIFTKFIEST